jgi:hypothetical protein
MSNTAVSNSDNVIQFPKTNVWNDLSHITNLEKAVEEAETARAYYAELTADEIMGFVLAKCQIAGYTMLESPENVRDAVMISEAIKSMLLRSQGINHPIQEFVDDVIDLDNIPEEKLPVSNLDLDDED